MIFGHILFMVVDIHMWVKWDQALLGTVYGAEVKWSACVYLFNCFALPLWLGRSQTAVQCSSCWVQTLWNFPDPWFVHYLPFSVEISDLWTTFESGLIWKSTCGYNHYLMVWLYIWHIFISSCFFFLSLYWCVFHVISSHFKLIFLSHSSIITQRAPIEQYLYLLFYYFMFRLTQTSCVWQDW